MPSRRSESLRLPRSRGFTLVELLLAVALSAVVVALAYAGISNGMQAANGMATQVEALAEVQRAFSIIEDDLVQARARPLMLGIDSREAALFTPPDPGVLLAFTRGGVANPRQLARSDLQRVRYELHGEGLWRMHWPQLDRADLQQRPQQVLLLQGISGVHFEFLPASVPLTLVNLSSLQSNAGLWQDSWNSDELQPALTTVLPIAVRMTLTTPRYGQVQRVFELP